MRGELYVPQAVTIFAHPGDDWMLHVAAKMLRPGDVAVVGTSSRT